MIAVMGTLFVISALMVCISSMCQTLANLFKIGAAYLAGARFDVAISELRKGKIFPKYDKGSEEAQDIAETYDHGEL